MKKYLVGTILYFATVLGTLFFIRETNLWNEFILDNIWPHIIIFLWLFQSIIYLIIKLLSNHNSNKRGDVITSVILSIPGTIISFIIFFYIVFRDALGSV
jgi:heme/copper-type cytochrome/quinol oxidase subunit 2